MLIVPVIFNGLLYANVLSAWPFVVFFAVQLAISALLGASIHVGADGVLRPLLGAAALLRIRGRRGRLARERPRRALLRSGKRVKLHAGADTKAIVERIESERALFSSRRKEAAPAPAVPLTPDGRTTRDWLRDLASSPTTPTTARAASPPSSSGASSRIRRPRLRFAPVPPSPFAVDSTTKAGSAFVSRPRRARLPSSAWRSKP